MTFPSLILPLDGAQHVKIIYATSSGDMFGRGKW